jgi:hypothetical protein
MLLHKRFDDRLKVERRQLYVGKGDASVLVLHNPGAGSAVWRTLRGVLPGCCVHARDVCWCMQTCP